MAVCADRNALIPAFDRQALSLETIGPNRGRYSLPITKRMISTTKMTPTMPLGA